MLKKLEMIPGSIEPQAEVKVNFQFYGMANRGGILNRLLMSEFD